VLVGFTFVFVSLGLIVTVTIDDLLAAAPRYQADLEALSGRIPLQFGLDLPTAWDDIWDFAIGEDQL